MQFKDPQVQAASKENFVTILAPRSKKEFQLREYTYGVLTQDQNDPISQVSVSNSSLSIDLWKGCSWQCAYCHIQGTLQDLDDSKLVMPNKPGKRSTHSNQEVVEALVSHPFFQARKSILSIGTASTEPFALKTRDEVFALMDLLVQKAPGNPIWIVTKAGFPTGYGERLANIIQSGTPVIISLCWANNPRDIEPVQNNRFAGIEEAVNAGAKVNWYMRPLTADWSANPKKIQEMFQIAEQYKDYLTAIVPGGLRWTEGIEYGLTEARNISMPNIPKSDNVKDLPDSIVELIHTLAAEYLPNIPVFDKSSAMLNHYLTSHKVNLTLDKLKPLPKSAIKKINETIAQLRLSEIKFIGRNEGRFITVPSLESLPYAIRQTITKAIIQACHEI